jgi:rare lipoprotein A
MQVCLRPVGLFLLAASLALAGCSSNKPNRLTSNNKPMFNSKGESLAGFAGTGSTYLKGNGPVPRGGGRFQVGKPYQVAGRWFHPKAQPGYDRQGAASWYGEAFHRRKTSNGEYFDMNMLSAAHPTLPLPSYAKVTNLRNGESVIVRINDRGPFVGTRIIDLSKKTADVLGFRGAGKADVRVQWLGNAPLNDRGSHLAMMNKKLKGGAGIKTLVAASGGNTVPATELVAAKQKRKPTSASSQLASAKVTSSSVLILVGTFNNVDNAQAAYDQVSRLGPAQLVELTGGAGVRYRVKLGPFRSKTGANDTLEQLRAEGFPDAVMVKPKYELAEAL